MKRDKAIAIEFWALSVIILGALVWGIVSGLASL